METLNFCISPWNCCRMNSISFTVVHPAFQNLKRSGRLLHLTAGGLILAHAISHFQQPDSSAIYFWCQFIVALDIFILVFAGRQLLVTMPKINLFFRFIEFIFFLGIAVLLFFEKKWLMASFHVLLSTIYIYLFYCEKKHDTWWIRRHSSYGHYNSGITGKQILYLVEYFKDWGPIWLHYHWNIPG